MYVEHCDANDNVRDDKAGLWMDRWGEDWESRAREFFAENCDKDVNLCLKVEKNTRTYLVLRKLEDAQADIHYFFREKSNDSWHAKAEANSKWWTLETHSLFPPYDKKSMWNYESSLLYGT